MSTSINDVMNLLEQINLEVQRLPARIKISANQVTVTSGLSDISTRLGLVTAGEFRTGNEKEPGFGFTGVRIGYPPFLYAGEYWNVVGINNDVLQFGISATDGKAYFGGGGVILDADGITMPQGTVNVGTVDPSMLKWDDGVAAYSAYIQEAQYETGEMIRMYKRKDAGDDQSDWLSLYMDDERNGIDVQFWMSAQADVVGASLFRMDINNMSFLRGYYPITGQKYLTVNSTSDDIDFLVLSDDGTSLIETDAVNNTVSIHGLVTDTFHWKNLVINGDMSIAQRGTSETGISTGATYRQAPDRFSFSVNLAGTWTVSQGSAFSGAFNKAYRAECTTAKATPDATSYLILRQKIEGNMLRRIRKGFGNAVDLTLSFWAMSTVTGTYIVELNDPTNTRHIAASYTIGTSETWGYKEITFPGDTTGEITIDETEGLWITWWFAAGSTYTSGTLQTTWGAQVNANRAVGQVNAASAVSNIFGITGVQLETSSAATEFEYVPYDLQLQRCQRYYHKIYPADTNSPFAHGHMISTTAGRFTFAYPVTMRIAPTLETSGTAADYSILHGVTGTQCNAVPVMSKANKDVASVQATIASGGTLGYGAQLRTDATNTTGYLAFYAEL